MALDLNAPLTQLVTLLKTISGLADEAGEARVTTGVPTSLDFRASAYVVGQPLQTSDKTTQLVTVDMGYLVVFGYRTGGDVAAAEAAALTYLAAFVALLYRPVNRKLGNTVESLTLDFSVAGGPEYEVHAGQEFRRLPVLVRTVQRFTP